MRPSRGMGIINSAKVPRTIKKRDGDDPVRLFKKGGRVKKFVEGEDVDSYGSSIKKMVKDFSSDADESNVVKRKPSVRFSSMDVGNLGDNRKYIPDNPAEAARYRAMGMGGKDKYATSIGGRLTADVPLDENSTLSPYVQGFAAQPKEGKAIGKINEYGVAYNRRFKQGGKVNAAGNYTKPSLRKKIVAQVKAAATQGTGAGQWSARKAQLVAKKYKAAGGGYKD